jgi:hypothetical protein
MDNGNDLKTVQALMGHSHIRTTEKYLHSTDDRKVEAIRSLQFGEWQRLYKHHNESKGVCCTEGDWGGIIGGSIRF